MDYFVAIFIFLIAAGAVIGGSLYRRHQASIKRGRDLWAKVSLRSKDYYPMLTFLERQFQNKLEVLQQNKNFKEELVSFELEGKTFYLLLKHVCALMYGENEWKRCLMVTCINDNALNETLGGGTYFITAVTEDWHKKIVANLTGTDL